MTTTTSLSSSPSPTSSPGRNGERGRDSLFKTLPPTASRCESIAGVRPPSLLVSKPQPPSLRQEPLLVVAWGKEMTPSDNDTGEEGSISSISAPTIPT
jgi:hypothetical protein